MPCTAAISFSIRFIFSSKFLTSYLFQTLTFCLNTQIFFTNWKALELKNFVFSTSLTTSIKPKIQKQNSSHLKGLTFISIYFFYLGARQQVHVYLLIQIHKNIPIIFNALLFLTISTWCQSNLALMSDPFLPFHFHFFFLFLISPI